jgi:hypothetical protein
MGTTVIGGMLFVTLIAIFLIPVTYYAAVNAPRRTRCALARIEWKALAHDLKRVHAAGASRN